MHLATGLPWHPSVITDCNTASLPSRGNCPHITSKSSRAYVSPQTASELLHLYWWKGRESHPFQGERTPRFVTFKFDACVIGCSKNCVPVWRQCFWAGSTSSKALTSQWCQLIWHLADEFVNKQLVILLIFVNKSILLTQSQWERCRMWTKWECRRCVSMDSKQKQ